MSNEPMPPVAPRPGSSLYYSALYADEDTRHRSLRTLNLISIIANSLIDVQDPAVAQQKIHWWHEELERLSTGNATHPALIACQSIHDNQRLKSHCSAILSAAANERMTPAHTEADLYAQLRPDYIARGSLLLDGLYGEPASDAIAERVVPVVADAFTHGERLRQIRRLLYRGIAVFSDEYYEKFNLKPEALVAHMNSEEPDEQINQLMSDRVDITAQSYAKADAVLSIELIKEEPKLLPLITLVRLRQQQIKLWQRQRPDLLRESMTPTPLRKFWLTWRLMRQTRK